MDRLFLDANVLFSAAYRPNAGLQRSWRLPEVQLCSSRYALEEARINLTETAQRHRLERLADKLSFHDSTSREILRGVNLPEEDIPILLAAIEAHCTHLITGDLRHFGPYLGKSLSGILVLTPADYLRLRGSR